jgi:hypothetical protein
MNFTENDEVNNLLINLVFSISNVSLYSMSKMKKLTSRITFKNHDDCQTIVISPTIERWQMNSLLIWLIAWSLCGAAFVYYMFFEIKSGNEIIVFSVLLVFWIYFEIRITKAFLWRKFGLEVIKIDEKELSIRDSIFKYGDAKVYDLSKIEPEHIEDVYINPASYGKVMNDSFWQVGQGTIALNYDEKVIYFGTQLENMDSSKLAKLIKKTIKAYKSKAAESSDAKEG